MKGGRWYNHTLSREILEFIILIQGLFDGLGVFGILWLCGGFGRHIFASEKEMKGREVADEVSKW